MKSVICCLVQMRIWRAESCKHKTREQLNQAFWGRLMFTLAQQRLSARKLRFDSGAIARMSPINSSDLTRAYTAAETLIAVPELIYRIKEQRQQHRLRLSNDRFTKTRCV
jgi:hypothetical protein